MTPGRAGERGLGRGGGADPAATAGITQLPNNMLTSAVIGGEIFQGSYKLLTKTSDASTRRGLESRCDRG